MMPRLLGFLAALDVINPPPPVRPANRYSHAGHGREPPPLARVSEGGSFGIPSSSSSGLSTSSNHLCHLFDPITQFLSVAPDVVLRRGSLVLHPVLSLFDLAADKATRRSARVWGKQDRQSDARSQPS